MSSKISAKVPAFQLNTKAILEEYWNWGKLAVTSSVKIFTELTPWLISLAFVGQISSVQLAALSLVELWLYTFLEIAWYSITSTSSVLIAQADGAGAKNAKHGWLLISLVAMTAASSVVAMSSLSTSYILSHLTKDQSLVSLGSYYTRYVLPAIYISGYQQVLSTYLLSTGYEEYCMISSFLYCIIDIFVTYSFLFGLSTHPFNSSSSLISTRDIWVIAPYDNALIGIAMSWNVSSAFGLLVNCVILYYVIVRWEPEEDDEDDEDRESKEGLELLLEAARSPEQDDDSADEEMPLQPVDSVRSYYQANGITFHKSSKKDLSADLIVEQRLVPSSSLSAAGYDDLESGKNLRRSSYESIGSRLDSEPINNPALEGEKVDDEEEADIVNDHRSITEWLSNNRAWKRFCSILLPTIVTSTTENLIFLLLGLLVARLSRSQIAAHNTCSAIIEYAFSFVWGMAEATTVRIGYYIGKGDSTGSYTVMWIAIINSTVIGFLFSFLCNKYSQDIAMIFTEDPEIIHYIVQLSPILYASLAIFAAGDQMMAVLQGQGRSKLTMYLSIGSLWGITIPAAYYCFYFVPGAKLPQIWWSLCLGYIVLEIIGVYCVYNSDWENLFLKAKRYSNLEEEIMLVRGAKEIEEELEQNNSITENERYG
jgi:Na+-driven multidrug efflux pump